MIYLVAWTGGKANQPPVLRFFHDKDEAYNYAYGSREESVDEGDWIHVLEVDPADPDNYKMSKDI